MTRRARDDRGAVTALELVLVTPVFLVPVVFVVLSCLVTIPNAPRRRDRSADPACERRLG